MKITERRLRNIIRSVIKESMHNSQQSLESAIDACRGHVPGEDPYIYDDEVQSRIEDYILDNFSRDLDYANTHGAPLDSQFSQGSRAYRDALASQRTEEDYDFVIRNMSPDLYSDLISACS